MSCTRHFLNFTWEHHSWRPRVVSTQYAPSDDTNMWGRVVHNRFVRCQKEDVCTECGKTRASRNCICDCSEGEECKIRLEALEQARHP